LKQLFAVTLFLFTATLFAQQGTTSPYSFFGIGSLKFKGTIENRSMGGIGILADSIHINVQNPATASQLRLVTYSLAGSYRRTDLKTSDDKQTATTTSLDYLAMGIPMGKVGVNFGLLPYTSSGYKLQNQSNDVITQYEGSGGLNKAFLAVGYELLPGLSLGVDANYNFGNIESVATTFQEDVEFGTREINRSSVLGFSFNFGAHYKTTFSNRLEWTASATYTPETEFTSENDRILATLLVLTNGTETPIDLRNIDVDNTDFTNPSKIALGTGIGKAKRWFVGAEFVSQKTSNFVNRTADLGEVFFEDAISFKAGGYYIPNYNAISSYFKRVVYRAGFRFEETGVNVNGESINEFGISFGVGLPVGRMFSSLNLGFEVGRLGTTNQGLVEETFFNTFISLSLNDKWFEKRYYD